MSKGSVKMAETQEKTPAAAKTHNNKRKRDDSEKQSQGATSASKKRKPFHERRNKHDKKNKKGKNAGKGGKENAKKATETQKKPEREEAFDESIGKMDAQLLADYFLQKAKRHNKDLTAVELSDMSIPVHAFLDTTSFQEPRTLAQLPEYLKACDPSKGSDLGVAPEEKGSPHTLVVTAAGLRAADLVRALRSFQSKDATVAKLFAKHIKIDEAKQFLERARTNIGVGTPQRIIDLIEAGSLKTKDLKRIVVDGSHIDQKKRGIFDMKETYFPLLQLLTRPEFRERFGIDEQNLKVLVY